MPRSQSSPNLRRCDYIGKRSLTLPEHVKPDRLQLVGLCPTPGPSQKPAAGGAWSGASVTCGGAVRALGPMALGSVAARAGRQHIGSEVTLYDAGKPVGTAQVVNPPFYDASGDRMNA
jgi:glycine cleavage system aminomethyltransferase T